MTNAAQTASLESFTLTLLAIAAAGYDGVSVFFLNHSAVREILRSSEAVRCGGDRIHITPAGDRAAACYS